MFQGEPAAVGSPEQIKVWIAFSAPPQPQRLWLAGLPRESLYLDQDDRPPHDGRFLEVLSPWTALELGMQPGPSTRPHLPIVLVVADMLMSGFWPGGRVFAGELGTVSPGTSALAGRPPRGIGVEATPRVEPHENLRAVPSKLL